jgi:hypothetical protein
MKPIKEIAMDYIKGVVSFLLLLGVVIAVGYYSQYYIQGDIGITYLIYGFATFIFAILTPLGMTYLLNLSTKNVKLQKTKNTK